jgi:oxygen-dependent protoporphyrinogen oxidase
MSAEGSPPGPDVIVVGGGISGLATAFELQRRGKAVEVLEAGGRAGGVIGTQRRDGALFETGPNSVLDSTPLINELLDALGIRGERMDASAAAATRFIVRAGRLVPLPASPGALFMSPAFTAGAKFRLWREPFIAPAPADVEESIADFARRRLGAEILEYAIDPFVAGVYAGDPDRISMAAAFPRIHALERKYGSVIRGQIQSARERRRSGPRAATAGGSFSFRNGMQTLTDALARAVTHVTFGSEVGRIERQPDGRWMLTGTRAGEPFARHARSIVLATPALPTAGLVREHAPAAAEALAEIPYAPVAIVVSAYRRGDVAHSLAGFGFLVPRRELRKILGTLFSSSMFEGRAPADTVLLTSFVGGMRQPELAAKADDELAAIVHRELEALVGAREPPLWTAVTRWTRAIPQYNLGHLERLRAIEEAEQALPGLTFCANYRGGVSVGDRIQAARAAADRIAAVPQATARP